ncbi:MAG: c-type cytochrome, partial [Chloroflexota bacterium]
MNLGSYEGIMLGGDVLSEPPGVQIVVPGDWKASKLRGRLRDNRMPPGWFFDIEEGNRNGPVIIAGAPLEAAVEPTAAPTAEPTAVPAEVTIAPTPAPTRTETTQQPEKPWVLAVFVGLTLALGLAVGFFALKAMGEGARTTGVLALILAAVALVMGIVAIAVFNSDQYVKVTTIREEVLVEAGSAAQPVVYETVEDRLKAWQAKLPPEYAGLTSPFAVNDAEVVSAGRQTFRDNNCAVCHGSELKGDGDFSAALNPRPVNLTDPALMSLPFVTDTYLFWRVSEGGSQTPFLSAMPMWKVKLSDEERWQLVAFIRSQTAVEAVAEGDQAAIAVVEKAGCFACHRLADRGGKIGPSWDDVGTTAATRVAGLSAEDYIRQSILEPGAFTVP